MIRCYNCGEEGHKTQQCTEHGPWYPEPGKTSQDYADLVEKIGNIFAADIIREHEEHGHVMVDTSGTGQGESGASGDH